MRRKRREEEPMTSAEPAIESAVDPTPLAEPRRITPIDIQQKEFRVAMRGYHEGEVDRFLDEVTEEMARLYAENKRLREDLEFTRTTRHDVGAGVEAEAIVRRAREEAARLLADARATAQVQANPGPPGAPQAALAPFIARERQFLQDLANLIQDHAEGVKGELRRSRGGPGAGSPSTGRPGAHRAGASVPADDDAVDPTASAPVDWRRYYETPEGEPPTPPAVSAPGPEEDSPEDRSLRELFWGED
jgi:DivIVA domain-containing protein